MERHFPTEPGRRAFDPNRRRCNRWSAKSDPGVKYFSGTATYSNSVQAADAWLHAGARVLLDLGTVNDVAEVSVNGKSLGILWKPPYRVDVTDALKPGENQLQIKVTNEWTNRIAGDRLLPADQRVLVAGARLGLDLPAANRPLPESGLLGPVTIMSSTVQAVGSLRRTSP